MISRLNEDGIHSNDMDLFQCFLSIECGVFFRSRPKNSGRRVGVVVGGHQPHEPHATSLAQSGGLGGRTCSHRLAAAASCGLPWRRVASPPLGKATGAGLAVLGQGSHPAPENNRPTKAKPIQKHRGPVLASTLTTTTFSFLSHSNENKTCSCKLFVLCWTPSRPGFIAPSPFSHQTPFPLQVARCFPTVTTSPPALISPPR